MDKTILILFLMAGAVMADAICTGDATPNLNSNLILNCTTAPSQSQCYAHVVSNSTSNTNMGDYPASCFGEDKICVNVFPDGSFPISIFLGSNYNTQDGYTATIHCSNPADNSTNSTTFDFQPTIYAPPNEVSTGLVWLKTYAVYGVAVLIIIGFVLLALRFFGIWR